MRGGGDTKLQRSPNGVRTPAGSKGTNIVRELTVALAHSQAARSLHSGGRPDVHGTDVTWGSARHLAGCVQRAFRSTMLVITKLPDVCAYQVGAAPELTAPMTRERTARRPRLPAALQPPAGERAGLNVPTLEAAMSRPTGRRRHVDLSCSALGTEHLPGAALSQRQTSSLIDRTPLAAAAPRRTAPKMSRGLSQPHGGGGMSAPAAWRLNRVVSWPAAADLAESMTGHECGAERRT